MSNSTTVTTMQVEVKEPPRPLHDTHAIPPQAVQEVYWKYNQMKASAFGDDHDILDFSRGLSPEQAKFWKPVATIPSEVIKKACLAFSNYGNASQANGIESDSSVDDTKPATLFEHPDFPGLQLVPSLLPPETQVHLVSRLMHRDLSNPHHKISLQADYHVPYPEATSKDESTLEDRPSFFTYPPSSVLPQHTLQPLSTSQLPAPSKPLSPATFLSRKLRWLTIGSQYEWKTRSYSGKDPTIFPPDMAALVEEIFRDINPFRSESGVVLLYSPKDYMPVHRDVSEECQNGLLSISLGCDGIFIISKPEENAPSSDHTKDEGHKPELTNDTCKTMVIRVRSGDVVRMSGTMRWAWHAMPKVIPGTAPKFLQKWPVGTGKNAAEERAYGKWKGYMAAKRINLSCRQVWD